MINFKRFPLKGGINGAGSVLRKSWRFQGLQQMQPSPLCATLKPTIDNEYIKKNIWWFSKIKQQLRQ